MSDPFAFILGYIVLAGLFLIGVVHFGRFVHAEVWPTVETLIAWIRRLLG